MEFDVIHTEDPCVEFAPSVLPEESPNGNHVNLGVSTRYCLNPTKKEAVDETGQDTAEATEDAHWYVLKTTYGRERKACDYLISKNVKTFYPTVTTVKEIQGKRKSVTESRLPNLFFAYGTEEELTPLVQRNQDIPYLRFYCRFYREAGRVKREIITVPQRQMDSLVKLCKSDEEDVLLFPETIHKFEKGEMVRVVKGPFCGVEGRVARFKGQQRVGVVVGGMFTVLTAYVPTAFLEVIES